MTPPKEGGRRLPIVFIPYNGTQEEEIEVLKMVFRLDGSNPLKDDAYNNTPFYRYKPAWAYDEADYDTYLITLYGDMNVMNKYVAIEDMMKHMISTNHVHVSSTIDEGTRRYMYSPALQEYLHKLAPPTLTRSRTAAREPSRRLTEAFTDGEEEEFDFSDEKDTGGTEETKQDEIWTTSTVKKDREERDQRTDARETTRQKLTKKNPPNQEKNFSMFESDDEEDEEEEIVIELSLIHI